MIFCESRSQKCRDLTLWFDSSALIYVADCLNSYDIVIEKGFIYDSELEHNKIQKINGYVKKNRTWELTKESFLCVNTELFENQKPHWAFQNYPQIQSKAVSKQLRSILNRL